MAIVLGLPKGSLQESTFALFKRAGFNVSCSSRSYIPTIDDEEIKCRLLRPQEMSRYVELGLLDAGICGYDWVYENGSDVHEICELNYSKATSNPVRWVLAVPNDSKIKSVKDLNGKRISTEAIGLVKRYLKKQLQSGKWEFVEQLCGLSPEDAMDVEGKKYMPFYMTLMAPDSVFEKLFPYFDLSSRDPGGNSLLLPALVHGLCNNSTERYSFLRLQGLDPDEKNIAGFSADDLAWYVEDIKKNMK